jgi:hypothetical protein
MSSAELIADVTQGALMAGAVEPAYGRGNSEGAADMGGTCLNCSTVLIGRHCYQCGQPANVHKTLGAFFHDLLHGVFHFEGKVWRTLPLLAWRPGRLTREYIDGRRVSYVSPVALFLFAVFLSFAIFNLSGNHIEYDDQGRIKGLANEMAKAEKDAVKELAEAERRFISARVAKDANLIELEQERDSRRVALAIIQAANEGALTGDATVQTGGSQAALAAINAAWTNARQKPELMLYKL